MTPRTHVIFGGTVAILCGALLFMPDSHAADIGYAEEFALAKDRETALKQLIVGTEDYYYFHCLHYLNTEQFAKIEPLSKIWYERFNQTPRLTEIQSRFALLTYDKDPRKSLDYLKAKLNLVFNHSKENAGETPNFPVALDPKAITRAAFSTVAFGYGNLSQFEESALDWLAQDKLSWQNRRELLSRLRRPDMPNLVLLIHADLQAEHPPAFGAYAIHTLLTRSQLDELIALDKNYLNNWAVVNAYLTKLQPGADEDWKHNRKLARAYFERLQAFAERLPPAFNALRAHVLYHRLVFDRARGVFDRKLFLEYLKLPRNQFYMTQVMLESRAAKEAPADLTVNYTPFTLLPIVNSDEPLVRSYLEFFFREDTTTKEFDPYIGDSYLSKLFAETKLTLGLGDTEKWAALLTPEQLQALKNRVEIDFAFTNTANFAVADAIRLELSVKNVPTLTVKVYEVNTTGYYRANQKEIDTDISLDGLVANAEFAIAGHADPLRRTAVTVTLPDANRKPVVPEPNRPGVYVVDLIGNGMSSRALVRKGKLRTLVVTGSAGQKLRVIDETNTPVPTATVWLGGTEYTPDAEGIITVPFSTAPGQRPIVVTNGDFSSLDYLQHEAENPILNVGFHIDRESLLPQRLAKLVVRPGLSVNGSPVSVSLLEDVRLKMISTDLDGVPTTVEIPNFKLFEDRETTHEFRVPPRLATIQMTLTAKVKSLSTGADVNVQAGKTIGVNGIDRTDRIEDLHLAKFGTDHVLELLGRTGEAKPDRVVQLAIKHRDFKQPYQATLKTDAKGRVNLGPLADMTTVTATGPEGTSHTWPLREDRHTYRRLVHAKVGEVVSVPDVGSVGKPSREELALFEVHEAVILTDRFDAITIANGTIELRNLSAGDYDLWLKRSQERIRIRIVDGVVSNGFLLGSLRHVQLPGLAPIHIENITSDADSVLVQLKNFNKFGRVHVFATRYQPFFDAYADLATVRDAELRGTYPATPDSVYLTGRNIGDELRYVLERRNQKKFPGNMLERPMLLLNPWAIRSTETGEQLAASGEQFGSLGAIPAPKPMMDKPKGDMDAASRMPSFPSDFANLDYLMNASVVALNLVPDDKGLVKVSRKDIGAHALLQVVALDPLSATSRSYALPEVPAVFADLRMKNGLDPAKHFTQQKQTTTLEAGKEFKLNDPAGSRFEVYDSSAKVFTLFTTLTHDAKLAEFSFVLRWNTMKIEEKRELYSKFACHELHFFLFKKDKEFFNTVVKPYLANKKDKTFLDRWLLGENVQGYTQPWNYDRLNIAERVLLARVIAGEPARLARHLDDLLKLLPPMIDRELYLFNVAVAGSLMETNGTLGAFDLPAPGAPPLPAEPMAGAPGGGGGFAGGGRPGGLGGPSGGFPAGEAPMDKSPGREALRDVPAKSEEKADAKKMKDGRGGISLKEAEKSASDDEVRKRSADTYFGKDRVAVLARALYRKLDPTMEWAENNYYKLPIQQQLADLVTVNPFWADYAKHDDKSPFLSKHFAVCGKSFTEMMFALSVLELPFEAGQHETKFDAGVMTFKAASRAILFHEEVKPAVGAGGQLPILVSQNYYRNGDRFQTVDGEARDKYVSEEFLINTVYGCQVVVTNPSSSPQKLSVLVQLPNGALPLNAAKYTKAHQANLAPYSTATVDYLFYFPLPGEFLQFPAHVAKNEQFVMAAKPQTFKVLAKPSKLDTTTWDHVSQNGTNEDVLAFLNRENVRSLNLEKIAFRMKDRAFFTSVIEVLQARHFYHPTLYSYGLYHAEARAAQQYLLHADALIAECGGFLVSPLLTIDPLARHTYEHLEYKPLVNARAHALGKRRQIVNDRLFAQYHQLLHQLSYRTSLDDTDLLAVTYYLLLQDRIDEAQDAFGRVNRERISTKLQYDYCAAYLDLSAEDPKKARAIALQYANHPVDRWRNTFKTVLAQVDEIEGQAGAVIDKENRDQQQGQLAATEPNFEVTLEGKTVTLAHQNVESVRINYYPMDVELLFSSNPFVQQSNGQFQSIKPNKTEVVKLDKTQKKSTFAVPAEFATKNVLIEVTAAGKSRSVPYYATAMTVTMTENYGQLKAASTGDGKGLSRVYVKVYVKLADGTVKFHKDGYTDLRGRFDYVSVNTPERQAIERFSVLILSEERGALIREAAPPQR